MDLRPHEADAEFTIATYKDEEEAVPIAEALAPLHQRVLAYLGLRDIDVQSDPTLTVLDDGRIELAHETTRLARFAGKVAKQSASRLPRRKTVYESEKANQDLADTINRYISSRTMSLPTPPVRPPNPEPTPNELARSEAFKKIKQPHERIFSGSALALFGGGVVAGAGRIVEVFSVNPSIPHHVNETVRQIGNDMSYAGVAGSALGLVITHVIVNGRIRNEQGFEAGWNEAVNRLDPDGQVEASLNTELSQVQSPTQIE